MKRVLILLMAALAVSGFASNAEKRIAEAEKFFREGLDLMKTDASASAAAFEKSEALYRASAAEFPNAAVYLCLGNTAFLRHDFPKAVYYYRQSQSFRDNASVRTALNAARLRLNEEIEVPIQVKIFETVFFPHYRIPFSVRAAVLPLLLFGLSLIAASALIHGRWGRKKAAAVVVAFLLAADFLSVTVTAAEKTFRREGVILTEIEGRSGNHLAYDAAYLRPIPAGSEVTVTDERFGWMRIVLRDRSRCWVPKEAVSLIGDPLQ